MCRDQVMTHQEQLIIKVGDLLRNPGKLDKLELQGIMLEELLGLSGDGLDASLVLQGVSDGSVKVVITQAKATIHSVCDISGEDYERQVEVKNFDARFSTSIDSSSDRVYDDVFPLDASSETINIADFLVQSIQMQEPLVHIKPGNEKLLENYSDEDDEENDFGASNIVYH